MRDRCYHINEPGVGRVLIPACIGSAVYGAGGCTCPRPPRTPRETRSIEDRLAALERNVTRLCEAVEAQQTIAKSTE